MAGELPTPVWSVCIDWNGDGDFSDANEDITKYVHNARWSLGMKRAYQGTDDEITATIEVYNQDKRFSPEAAGPLSGYLVPQKAVRIQCTYAGVTTVHWRGWTNTFNAVPGTAGERKTVISCRGNRWLLERAEVFLSLMEDVTADEVLRAILDQLTLPPADVDGDWVLGIPNYSELGDTTWLADTDDVYDFETGVEVFAYVGDNWEDGIRATQAIGQVIEAERGKFFIARDGKATFFNRSNFQSNDTVVFTGVDTSFESIAYSYGTSISNVIHTRARPRLISDGTTDVLWRLDKPMTIGPRQTKTIRARFADDSGAEISARYVNTPNRGAGTLVTETFALDMQFEADARSAKITLFNKKVALDIEITDLIITGQKITSFNEIDIEARDETSIGLYGQRELSFNTGLLDDEETARSIAEYELSRRKDPRGEVASVKIRNYDLTAMNHMINRTIGDRISVSETQTAHSAEYFIIGEEHELWNGLNHWRTTWRLEPASASIGWLIGIPGRSELGQTTYLGL